MAQLTRIAYLSPLAPTESDISDYSEALLPQLCQWAQVDAYTDDRVAATQKVGRVYPLYGYRDLPAQRERYGHMLYHLGNGPEHVPVFALFQRFGGVAVLHDLELTAILHAQTVRQDLGFLRTVRRQGGLGPWLQNAGEVLLRGRRLQSGPELVSLVMRRAEGVMVHSQAAYEHLRLRFPEARIAQAPIGIPVPPQIDPLAARRALELPEDAFICLSLGLDPAKRINVALQAFARLLDRCPNALYVLIGEPSPAYPITEQAQTLGIADRVCLTGPVDAVTFDRYLAACDVGISLAYSAWSGLSTSVLRIMSHGRPTIVANRLPHSLLPNDCTIKVDVGASEVPQIVAALWALSEHQPMRRWYGRQAARYAQSKHTLSAAAQRYFDFLYNLESARAGKELVLSEQLV